MRRADGLSTSGGGADAPDLLRTRSLIALKSPTNKQPDGSATRPGGFAGVGQAAESAVEPEPPPDGARDGAWQVEQGGRALGDLPGEECQKGQEDDVVGPSVPFAVGSEVAGPNPIEDCDRDQRDRIAVAPRRRQKRRLPPRALGGGRRGCGGGGTIATPPSGGALRPSSPAIVRSSRSSAASLANAVPSASKIQLLVEPAFASRPACGVKVRL